jgi:hypothetical protein
VKVKGYIRKRSLLSPTDVCNFVKTLHYKEI